MIAEIVLGAILGTLVYLWGYLRELYRYWEDKGVPHLKPWPLIGNSRIFSGSPFQLYVQIYNDFPNDNVIGFYEFLKKKLLIRNTEVINKVLVKEFGSFTDRGVGVPEEVSEVDSGLFTMEGSRWRAVRAKITPAFSSGRLKAMFPQILECASNLAGYLEERSEVDVETRDLMFMYTTDVIATTAFGIDAGTMKNPESEFRGMAMKSFNIDFKRFLSLLVLSNLPSLGKAFKVTFTPRDVARYFSGIIKETLGERERSGAVRNDFVQLLLELKEKGEIQWTPPDPEDEYLGNEPPPPECFKMTDQMLTSQAFTFLSAGSGPVANSLTFALLELAKNEEVQERARLEVESIITTHGGFNYQAVRQMTYLEQCINETLRMYPVVKQLLRKCTETTELEPGLLVERGTEVVVPLAAISHDPLIYPRPDSFIPERFDNPPPKGAYLPFGYGPRMCIAMRFAIVEMKVALATILHRYRVIQSPKTKEIVMNNWSFFTVPSHGIYLTYIDRHPSECARCTSTNSSPLHHYE